MMKLCSFLVLSCWMAIVAGFQTLHSSVPLRFNIALSSSSSSSWRTPDGEVSRRVALVTAAALAAGAPPAHAASLAQKVSELENENIKEVNTKGAPEKHLPQVGVSKNKVEVLVPHVMDPEKPHYIEYIWLKDMKTDRVVAVKAFEATDPSPPTLTASVKKGSTVKPLLFCNLHGLWEGEELTV